MILTCANVFLSFFFLLLSILFCFVLFCIFIGSGVSNARSMAKIASLLANGGSPFLSDDGLKKAMEFAEYYDVLLGMRFNFTASGWGIDRIRTERLDNLVGWFGAGGSAFQFSPKHNLAFAYVPAFLTPRLTKPRVYKLLNAVEKVMFD